MNGGRDLDPTERVPMALRAFIRGWLARSDALSALPNAPVVDDRPRTVTGPTAVPSRWPCWRLRVGSTQWQLSRIG